MHRDLRDWSAANLRAWSPRRYGQPAVSAQSLIE